MKLLTKPQIETWPIERLIPYARNARTHSKSQIAQIAAGIREFGFNGAVLIDAEGNILAGHGRVLAALSLGMTEVPVLILDHLDQNQKRAFRLADNKLALNAGWDEEMLHRELQALAEQEIDLSLTGFAEEELKQALAQLKADPFTDPERSPETEDTPVTTAGDLWLLGCHGVLCGNGTSKDDLDRVLDGRRSKMVFTDLAHNGAPAGKKSGKSTPILDNLRRESELFLSAACRSLLSVNEGAFYLCPSSSELHTLYRAFTEAGGHWSAYLIWARDTFALGRSDYKSQFEAILYGWAEGQHHYWCGKKDQGDVWFAQKPDADRSGKPIELIERAVTNSSRRRDVVLDPFAGSGSTLMACENTVRNACLIETDPRSVDGIVRRWQAHSGKTACRVQDGKAFDALARQTTTGTEEAAA